MNIKRQFISKVDNKFKEGSPKAACQGLNLITGFESRSRIKVNVSAAMMMYLSL